MWHYQNSQGPQGARNKETWAWWIIFWRWFSVLHSGETGRRQRMRSVNLKVAGKGTREGIFNMRMICDCYSEVNRDECACFIDYEKAFDWIDHEKMMMVGFLRQTRSRYLRYRLEAKMAGVILGLGGFIEIVLVTNGAWRLMRVWRTLSYCRASSVAFIFGYLIRSEF